MFRYVLFLLLCSSILSAQSVDPRRNTVVATKGLNLRTAPGASSEIISGIPFGATVDVYDRCDYGHATIETISDYYRYDSNHGRPEYLDHHVTGKWVRVTYDRDTGYVFDAYLSEPFTTPTVLDDDANEISPEIVLLEPGLDVRRSAYDPAVYHYYGVYETGPDRLALRAVSLDYFVARHDSFTTLFASAKPSRDLLFIIGSKERMRPHTFSGKHFTRQSLLYSTHGEAAGMDLPDVPGLAVEPAGVDTYAEGPNISVATTDGWVPLVPEYTYAEEVHLIGAGDVDGDGLADYRLAYVSEHNWRTVLFLSSKKWRSASLNHSS